MASMSLMHWLVVFFYLGFVYVITGIPVARIMRRTGYSGWWSLLVLIPLVNLIGLWVFAFARWPGRNTEATR
jgi:uncharacterized membrane protein YhaH (DUF805 family)